MKRHANMGAFDRALERVSEAEREYRRTIGRAIHASFLSTWRIAAICAKAWLFSVFPTVQWIALAWICLSSSNLPAQAVGGIIGAFIVVAAGCFWLTLLYEGGAVTGSEEQATKQAETGFWKSLWLLIVPLRGVTKFMVSYYAVWLAGSLLLSYAHHRYYSQLPANPALDINQAWWMLVTEQLPAQLMELHHWIAIEIQRL